ncbi:MAG: YkgJ family cysteine cluster protein [Candidatus Gastranaerophilales bacterium]|nr:YkgJ family cysteine cluster protein [Candidatus Gastranaerophilales bacterium]
MFKKLKKFYYTKILGKKYYRTGQCKGCGRCCRQIYVKHAKGVIKDEKDFENLKYQHRFYTYLKVTGKDEIGLIFECQNLDSKTHLCKIHKTRPGICRRYPQEEIFGIGGALSENCGFSLIPVESFDEVFEKVKKQSDKKNFWARLIRK